MYTLGELQILNQSLHISVPFSDCVRRGGGAIIKTGT